MIRKKLDVGHWMKVAVCLFLMFGFGCLPAVGNLTPLGMRVLGAFLGMLFGWTTLGFVWPSILAVVALGLSGYASVPALISTGMGSPSVTLFVLFLLIFANFLNNIGLSAVVANWFISRRFTVGRPWMFSFMMLLCVFVLSAAVSLYASIFLMWNIFYSICRTVGFKPYEKYPMLMLAGLAFSATWGYAVFPFRMVPVMAAQAFAAVSGGAQVDVGQFAVLSGVLAIGSLTAYVLLCKFVFRPDVTPLLHAGDIFADLRCQAMTAQQKIGAGSTLALFFALFAPSIFPKDSVIGSFFGTLGMVGSLALIMGLLSIIRVEEKPIFVFSECAKTVNWNLIIMFMAIVPMSDALGSPEVGIMDFIMDLISPVFLSMSPEVFTVTFLIGMALLTQFTQNMVLAAVIPPILYSFCSHMGVDPLLMLVLFTFGVSCGLATPSASATSAMVFANTDWIEVKYSYKYCITAAAISIAAMLLIGLPLGKLLF